MGSRSLQEAEDEWERLAAAARLRPSTMDAHFGEQHAATMERAREMQEAVDMQAWAIAQQMSARRYVPIFGGPPEPAGEAQMIYDAVVDPTLDDGNVSSRASSRRDFASLDAYNLESPPQSARSSRSAASSNGATSSSTSSSSSSSAGGGPPGSGLNLALSLLRPSAAPTLRDQAANVLRGAATPFVIPAGVAAETIEALIRQFHGARSTGAAITYMRQPQDHPRLDEEAEYRPARRRAGRSGGPLRPALVA